jgi:DNA polymerase III subunit gamma/tau
MSNGQEKFIVSARKYRPESWKEVIGQESITETLLNSIQQDHMAHAYLFCGPRGVGKTTCARIFAKEINRSEDHGEDEDFSFNIFELDAASNNSVDDIRSLTDQVRIPPQVGKYKVYIIDEVHMLSKQAFNAFLKTLEEPPKHAIFILATTEKHKIIPTILSRCQIYDFNRIGIEDVVMQLKGIAEKENIKYEEEALHVVAQKADGAMRDALSIFDQLSSFTNENLTYEAVLKNLHVLDYDYYFKVTDFLYKSDFAEVLVILDSILKQGFDGSHFISGLAGHFRDLLVCKDPRTLGLLEVGDSVKAKYRDQAQNIDSAWILSALTLASETDFKYRNASNQRLLLETSMLNIASLDLEKKNSQPEVKILPAPTEKKKLEESPKKEAAAIQEKQPAAEEVKTEVQEEAEEPLESKDPSDLEDFEDSVEPHEENLEESEEPLVKIQQESTPPEDAPISRRTRRKPSTVSLKLENTLEEKAPAVKEIIEDQVDEIKEQAIESSEEKLELESAWKRLSTESFEEGKSALYSIMAKQKIAEQIEDEVITVILSHEVDQEEFIQHSAHVLMKLRQYMQTPSLGLKTLVQETKHETKLFTAQDKFEYLASQNPVLRKLKQDLDLDISH